MKVIWRKCDFEFCNLDQGDGDGYGFAGPDNDDGYGAADGNGDSGGSGDGGGAGHGYFTARVSLLDGGGDGSGRGEMSMGNEESRRTERIFRCAGCIGGYECSIHGRKI